MKWPLVTRAKHETALSVQLENTREHLRNLDKMHIDKQVTLCAELTKVRQNLLAVQNENAKLRGQLVAEHHEQGKPG